MTPPSEIEKAKVADEVTERLRDEVGLPDVAITAWWQWMTDTEVRKTPHRVWESGDFETLDRLVEKTVTDPGAYRTALERVISERFALELAQSREVRERLLGGLNLPR